MSPTYEPNELTNQFSQYDELKQDTKEVCSRELGDQEEAAWEWDQVWDWAQDTYYDHHYDGVEQQAKFADAAYYRVQSNVDDPDWTEVKQRIADFVLPRHIDVQHSNDMPDYLPGSYTASATEEIVIHAITLELTEDR
ncbi:hypothetical protein SAMN04488066_11585 [Halorubrum aquaticum]|uniref:Uncharacterized protein n=1 Tax=Halorubrum aquaticum TaxID=387340 RepID=A0A1I3BUT8_9EURY|nr:hypothetical protein [Halorubrum aquaticum]SFH66064.1 hypothetical protein SAMN04488066_11585 [Halorubrum aquaticum]